MNERAFRCPSISILILALLLAALPGLVAADEAPRRISPRAMAAFQAVAPPQAKECRLCAFAHQHCSQACFSLAEKGGIGKCLTQCDYAAATCTCDPAVGLRSEDLVSREWVSSTKSHTCNDPVSCQPDYPSCASWTGYSTCDTHCFDSFPRCGPCTCDGSFCWCERGRGGTEYLERFRVCFDQFGNSCTEWETTFTNVCGC